MFNHVSCPLFGSWEKAWVSNRNPPQVISISWSFPNMSHTEIDQQASCFISSKASSDCYEWKRPSSHSGCEASYHSVHAVHTVHGRTRLVQLFTVLINPLTRQCCLTTITHWYCMWRMHCKSQVTVTRHWNLLDFIICSISGLWLANHTTATPQTQN